MKGDGGRELTEGGGGWAGRALIVLALGLACGGKGRPAPQKSEVQGVQEIGILREPPGLPLFRHYCSFCHGDGGAGDGLNAWNLDPRPADFTDPSWMTARTGEDLQKAIAQGGAALGKSPQMPPWGRTLTPQQIEDLVAYLRTLATEKESAGP